MSSIFGIVNKNKKPIEPATIQNMQGALNHWNADDAATWLNGSTGFGHLMLYNTPESLHEKLPFFEYDSQLTITADARIDNRDELFGKLNLPKTQQHLVADSTLILKAYEKFGENCVLHLIGDFAFAIWNEKEQTLFCARDHMGVKPFFYYHDENFFAFASEAKGLLEIEGVNKEINDVYFLKMASMLQPEIKETAYKHIFRLDVATCLTLKTSLHLKKYWELDTKKEIIYQNPDDYIENFRAIFTEAVRCRLRSNFLIGAELSGGLDSSGITAVAANILHAKNEKIASFSSSPGTKEEYNNPDECDEVYVDEVIRFSSIDIVNKRYNNKLIDDSLKEIDDNLSVYGYPCFGPLNWNNDFYELASSINVRTMLSGHGGDQLITDFDDSYVLQYINDKLYKKYFKIAIKQWGIKNAFLKFIQTTVHQPLPPTIEKIYRLFKFKHLKNSEYNFLPPSYLKQIISLIKFDGFAANFKEVQKRKITWEFISNRMEYETINGLKYKICPAFPMQDIRLVEFVLALPTFEKMQPGKNRYIFRRAMQGLLPEIIVNKKIKQTLPSVPPLQTKWLHRQNQIKGWLLELKKNKQLPSFINYDKLIRGYSWKKDSEIGFNELLTPRRRQIEMIIRWFEKKI